MHGGLISADGAGRCEEFVITEGLTKDLRIANYDWRISKNRVWYGLLTNSIRLKRVTLRGWRGMTLNGKLISTFVAGAILTSAITFVFQQREQRYQIEKIVAGYELFDMATAALLENNRTCTTNAALADPQLQKSCASLRQDAERGIKELESVAPSAKLRERLDLVLVHDAEWRRKASSRITTVKLVAGDSELKKSDGGFDSDMATEALELSSLIHSARLALREYYLAI